MNKTNQTFEEYLKKNNLSGNTLDAYLWTVDYYNAHYESVSKENLLAYKGYLMEFFKPKTVNLRIQAMNKYLSFLGKEKLHLKAVKIQQKNFLENVISNADYNFLKKQLKKDGNMEWYFVVWYLAATGARVSELIQIKVEHVEIGYFDLYTKGGKLRRLYIPKKLRNETIEWLKDIDRNSGYLFLNPETWLFILTIAISGSSLAEMRLESCWSAIVPVDRIMLLLPSFPCPALPPWAGRTFLTDRRRAMTEYEKLITAEQIAHTVEITECLTGKTGMANTCAGRVALFYGAEDGNDDKIVTPRTFSRQFKITAAILG